MDPAIIRRIGEQVGKVEDVDIGEGGLCVGKFARVRVSRSIDEPLVRCVPIQQEGLNKEALVILQYEKLPDFCFLCGRVGHISRDCKVENLDRLNPRYGGWLRAGRVFTGRRSLDVGNQSLITRPPHGSVGDRRGGLAWRNKDFEKEVAAEEGEGSRNPGAQNALGTLKGCGDGPNTKETRDDYTTELMEISSPKCAAKEDRGESARSDALEVETAGINVRDEHSGAVRLSISPGKSLKKSKKSEGKGWKRLAREKNKAADRGIHGNDRVGPSPEWGKRKELALDDEMGEEETRPKLKLAKLQDEDDCKTLTAAAAVQSRRSS